MKWCGGEKCRWLNCNCPPLWINCCVLNWAEKTDFIPFELWTLLLFLPLVHLALCRLFCRWWDWGLVAQIPNQKKVRWMWSDFNQRSCWCGIIKIIRSSHYLMKLNTIPLQVTYFTWPVIVRKGRKLSVFMLLINRLSVSSIKTGLLQCLLLTQKMKRNFILFENSFIYTMLDRKNRKQFICNFLGGSI